MAGGGENEVNLEYTPTWIVALVCSVIVAVSLSVERIIHYVGKYLLKKRQIPLFEALRKIKEELMLLGFISLLLTVCQDRIMRLCIPKHLTDDWLPCKKKEEGETTTAHFFTSLVPGMRRLLAGTSSDQNYCEEKMAGGGENEVNLEYTPTWIVALVCSVIVAVSLSVERIIHYVGKGKAQLLSLTSLHHLHIFIFVLAVSHVVFSALTVLCGGAKVRQWKTWEDAIQKKKFDPEKAMDKLTHVHEHEFVKGRFLGIGKCDSLLSWLISFGKQFYGSVTEADYATLRHGFIRMHSQGNPKFNFHMYIVRAFEADFKKVVGISWFLWVFVVVFLLLNVKGWHAYFWISFVPFGLLLLVGTKLEHIITQLAVEVAQRHVVVAGDLEVTPSDEHFWFRTPQLVIVLIHIILFQNSFEIGFFFFILVQYGFDSCIMGQVGYIVPRLVVGVIVQFLCSYSTLPLYAIVTLMGSKVKKSIFEEPIQESLNNWILKAKQTKGKRRVANGSTQQAPKESLENGSSKDYETMEEGKVGEIEQVTLPPSEYK
ncbi:hypothetical protein Leryth_001800 [Lithospermum erythrorhizon]|nr:hypothetical protein Leryth_001800 [Lithospermum erythrorhizon]